MSTKRIFKFSEVHGLKSAYSNFDKGCIIDTSVLFAIAYPNDSFNSEASDLFEDLADLHISLYTNVNIRAEFMNNMFQVIVPESLSDFHSKHGSALKLELSNKLKSNYAIVSKGRAEGVSYKFSTSKVNDWRDTLRKYAAIEGVDAWYEFCKSYIGDKIHSEWVDTCKETGLNFLSLRSDEKNDWMTGPIDWKDAADLMGNYGLGSFDAMIVNLFLNSHFPCLITADREIARAINHMNIKDKTVLIPDSLVI